MLKEASAHYKAISLSVSKSNPALSLYEREGFKVVKNINGQSVTMAKVLSSEEGETAPK